MNPLLSIIIPVYNVSRYLPDTLDTLSSQEGLDECEIICIDDGSTDTSLQILQSYKDRIPNLKIVSKQNEGVSATRNTGISMSEGKFISFIDADDLLHPHALRLILNEIRKGDADIICWRYRPFYSKPEYSDLADTGIIEISNKNLEAFDIMADKGIAVGIYLKGIKRELFFTPDVRFDTSMTYGEDMFVSWKCVLKAEKIILIDRPLYYYRQTSNSAVTRYHKDLYEKYANATEDIKLYLKQIGKYTEAYSRIADYHLTMRLPALTMMEYRAPYSKDQKRERLSTILKDRRISNTLANMESPDSYIFKLARQGDINGMLRNARIASLKTKILTPIKRLIK